MSEPPSYTESRLVAMMRESGVRPSVQRLAVLSLIANGRCHPTADELYDTLSQSCPTLSRTTVYNSLHALVDAALVRELDIESGTRHYDLAPQPRHAHFVCRSCGHIHDLPMPAGIDSHGATTFAIDSVDVVYRGLCPACVTASPQQQ